METVLCVPIRQVTATRPSPFRAHIFCMYMRAPLTTHTRCALGPQYERTGPRGFVTSVVRALPIAVLRPAAGATEAVSYTLLGLRNSLDPAARVDEEDLWNCDLPAAAQIGPAQKASTQFSTLPLTVICPLFIL